MTVRLGVIGAGEHSRTTHGPALRSVNRRWPGRVELAAACDLDGARAAAYAAEFGFARSYQDVEAMLSAERLDGLIAVTPVKATERVVSGLLPRRVPLVIEKPPGETAAAAQRLLERAQRHGCPHMVSFNRRFNPALVRARQWMEEAGEARRPRTVLGRMLRHARREAGFAVETGIHLIDAVLSLMGAPASVEVLRAGAGAAECCSYVAQMRFADQRAAVVVISPSVGVLEETLEIHGEDYCLKVDVGGQSAELWEDRRPRWRWATPESDERGIQDVIGETEAFVRAIEGKGPYWPDLTDAVAAMRVAEAVQGEGGEL